jgi:hypothetical protein
VKRYVLASLLALTALSYALAQDSPDPEFRPSYGTREDGSKIIYHRSGDNEIRQPDGATVTTRNGKVTEFKAPYGCEPFNQSQISTDTTPAIDPEDAVCYLYDIQYVTYSCKNREGAVEAIRRRYIISFRKHNPAIPCDGQTYVAAREQAKKQYGDEEWPDPPQTAEEPKPPKYGPGLPLPEANFKMPVLPKCFESIEARWEYADKLYDMFLGQVNAISFAANQAARDRAKSNVEALASLRAKSLLVEICPPRTSAGLVPPPSQGATPQPVRPLPLKPVTKPGVSAVPPKPRTGFLTEDEAKEREEQLKQDPDWPRRRAAIEKMIRERNKKGQDWLERDWFDWLLEQTGKLPADGCDDGQFACAINPNVVSDEQLKALVGEPQLRARIEDLINQSYSVGGVLDRGGDNPSAGARTPNATQIPGFDGGFGYPDGGNVPRPQPRPGGSPYEVPRNVPGVPPAPGSRTPRF